MLGARARNNGPSGANPFGEGARPRDRREAITVARSGADLRHDDWLGLDCPIRCPVTIPARRESRGPCRSALSPIGKVRKANPTAHAVGCRETWTASRTKATATHTTTGAMMANPATTTAATSATTVAGCDAGCERVAAAIATGRRATG